MEKSESADPRAVQLLEVVYRYFPRWDPSVESLEDYSRHYDSTPQARAIREALWEKPRIQREQWYTILTAIRHGLPSDHSLTDSTSPFHACFQGIVTLPRSVRSEEARAFVILASRLVPFYYVYDSRARRIDGEWEPSTLRYELPPDANSFLEIFDREFAQIGYERLPPSLGTLPIPDISVGNREPGQVTIADALFTEHRL